MSIVGRRYLDPGDSRTGKYDPPRPCVVVGQWGNTGPPSVGVIQWYPNPRDGTPVASSGPRNVAVEYEDGTIAVIPFTRRLRKEGGPGMPRKTLAEQRKAKEAAAPGNDLVPTKVIPPNELPPQSTEAEATARAARIKAGLATTHETLADIGDAFQQRDWAACGYESWEVYVADQFGSLPRIARDDRHGLILKLTDKGLPQRAVAAAVGASAATVNRELGMERVQHETPGTEDTEETGGPSPEQAPPPGAGEQQAGSQPSGTRSVPRPPPSDGPADDQDEARRAAQYVITTLDRARCTTATGNRTIQSLWDGKTAEVTSPSLILQVLDDFGDQVIQEHKYPQHVVRLAKKMRHDFASNPAGLMWRGEFIKSLYEPGDTSKVPDDPAVALKEELRSHAIAAGYIEDTYYDKNGVPVPELVAVVAGWAAEYVGQYNDRASRKRYARLLRFLADAGRLVGDSEIGYLPEPGRHPPRNELEAAARRANDLDDRMDVLKVRAAEAAAEYDRLKAEADQDDGA